MNGIEKSAYSTVHVTPEDGFSYASYEAMGFDPGSVRLEPLVKRVLKCFEPKEFSVAVTCNGGSQLWATEEADVEGYAVENIVKQKLPGGGLLVYKTYSVSSVSTRRSDKECAVRTHVLVLKTQCGVGRTL
ncbi:hypothetical protein LWI29_001608 [Acer saccharum]|uniref:Uncharacterized protein n=1 Tax=Acer saccharum TaxID=4024 RepID=A0AA39RBQ7_ACESA|nr:hypothetical protein LWI29_001608 [Acer saccharum]